jgi:DNA-binding response OmpR family regulator
MGCYTGLSPGRILVVDDSVNNLRLIAGFLKPSGYEVFLTTTGMGTMPLIKKYDIELVLLDISMPDITGLEVCNQLKSSEKTADIPVIFVTALSRHEDKLKGFSIGCADYVTKPFQMEEITARIKVHVKLFRLQREMKQLNTAMESVIARRTNDLEAAKRKLAILSDTKSQFLKLISHEVRTPLNGLLGAAELAFSMTSDDPGSELFKIYQSSRDRLMMLLDNALLLTQLDLVGSTVALNTSELSPVISATIAEDKLNQADGRHEIFYEQTELGRVNGDFLLLKKTLLCLLDAARRISEQGAKIAISCFPFEAEVYITMRISPARMKESELNGFFDLWVNSELVKSHESLGLNPAVANRIIQLLGGWIKISNVEKDVQIEVWLARHPKLEPADEPIT